MQACGFGGVLGSPVALLLPRHLLDRLHAGHQYQYPVHVHHVGADTADGAGEARVLPLVHQQHLPS